MNAMKRSKRFYFLISFLFFAMLVTGFVFACTDAEYNYNQQIARGFISKDAVFFDIDDLSYRKAVYYHYSFSVDEDVNEPIEIDTTPKAARDPTFVLKNKILDDGKTAVEALLSSGSKNYFASLHSGVMRGVAFSGKTMLPPLISGRFFTEEECLSDLPLAVIGKKREALTKKRNGKPYLNYLNKEYEVIGLVGLSGKSPMDDMIFVNLGSLSPEEQLNGSYYIDCSEDNEGVFNEMIEKSESLLGCGLKRRETPVAFIDLVSGGMYMKSYLKMLMVLLGLITFLSILIQSVREDLVKIAVMKVQGISQQKIFAKTIKGFLTAYFSGTLAGVLCVLCLILSGLFALPLMWLLKYCLLMTAAGVLMSGVWIIAVFLVELKTDPKGVIQKI